MKSFFVLSLMLLSGFTGFTQNTDASNEKALVSFVEAYDAHDFKKYA